MYGRLAGPGMSGGMCNAYNHAWDCDCGFGGDTGGGGPGFIGGIRRFVQVLERPASAGWAKDKRGRVESYVNPNAHCPVCGKLVYFYRSPYDGRVFFDELGWPWPKHSCTDNGLGPLRVTCESARAAGPRSVPRWQLEGWQPLLAAKLYTDGERQGITGDHDNRLHELLLPAGDKMDAEGPVFVRRQAACPHIYEVTYLQSRALGVQERATIAFDPRIARLGEDTLFRAARHEAVASDVVGRFILWQLDDPAAARPYLERAVRAGSFEALIDLAVLVLFGVECN